MLAALPGSVHASKMIVWGIFLDRLEPCTWRSLERYWVKWHIFWDLLSTRMQKSARSFILMCLGTLTWKWLGNYLVLHNYVGNLRFNLYSFSRQLSKDFFTQQYILCRLQLRLPMQSPWRRGRGKHHCKVERSSYIYMDIQSITQPKWWEKDGW